jgi:outer membrane protein assembly factor BamB
MMAARLPTNHRSGSDNFQIKPGVFAGLLRLAAFALVAATPTGAEDWPQYLGPERNGVSRGPAIAEKWDAGGPRVVWRKPVGAGFSGPVVAQGRLILFHRVADNEIVESFDARTGASQWRYSYPTTYRDDFGFDEGPRAVPVVADGVIYTFGAEGQLHAISLAEGKKIWSVDTRARFRVPKGWFGAAGSPLVEGGRLLANIGGQESGIVAFDAHTWYVLWSEME